MTRVALLSGGKDSYYAAYRAWPIDMGLVLVYEFPRPSPHLLNLGKTVETLLMMGIPITVARLSRGREFEETVNILRRLGADTIVAGDVYVEEHLRYMERLAGEAGARLLEPLWGMDTTELLYEEIRAGIKPLIIGGRPELGEWIGTVLGPSNVDRFVDSARRLGIDPLGERGEYHTLVIGGPLHRGELRFSVLAGEDYGGYRILRLL